MEASKQPKLKIYRIPRADGSKVPMPKYGTEGAACFDIYSNNQENIVIPAGKTVMIPSGMKMEIEAGWQMKLHNRSGMGAKKEVMLGHAVGTIDCDYRGEVFVPLYNRGTRPFIVEPEMRVCQAELVPVYTTIFEEVESETDLSSTERGDGGFGSTGTN